MQMFLLSDAKPRAQEIADFASRRENWYIPSTSTWVPGDRPEFVLKSGTIQAVFSWTVLDNGVTVRHMTVSSHTGRPLSETTGLPHPIVVWTLAHFFGFTGAELSTEEVVAGPAKSWKVAQIENPPCIAVVQRIPDEVVQRIPGEMN